MLLRRVIAHFRKQEWTAIFLDFLIVVAGVFVGLQVNNWNAARKDRADEALFLTRLHDDLQRGEVLTARLRDKRLLRAGLLVRATDVVFGRTTEPALGAPECEAIASAHYYNIVAPELPSVIELMSSGRMGIVRDAQLRTALVALQQTRDALVLLIGVQSPKSVDLPSVYPDLIRAEAAFNPEMGEVVSTFQCNLASMRDNQKFLNDLSGTSDRYDAFVRDGLAPWSAQFDETHQRVDAALGLSHEGRGSS
jgi:hypothetical protein